MKILNKTIAGSLFAAFCMLSACENDRQQVALETFKFAVSGAPVDTLDVDEVKPAVIIPVPENITEKIVWTSANPEIAQVQSNEQGLVAGVIGLKVGNTVISASTPDGRIGLSFPVTVIIKVKKITFSDEMILQAPGKGRFNVLFEPQNATIQDLVWTSGNPDVAGIDNITGDITALSPGSSVITATTKQGGKTASIELFVSGEPPVFGKDYCTMTASRGGDYSADKVSTSGAVQNLSHFNTSIPAGSYKYYSGEKLTVRKGESFTLDIEHSNTWSRTLVWIDWNGDKDFADEGERVVVFGDFEVLNPKTFSKLITVPENAVSGYARMRVITGDAWTFDLDIQNVEPCGTIRDGSIKDFPVEIIN